jgi:protein-tyrosine phosphatase
MTAEYALRALLEPEAPYTVGSAGIEATPQTVVPAVSARLLERGADCTGHVQRKLTRALLDEADLPVVLGLNHRAFVRDTFGRDSVLFNEVCFGEASPVLDVGEALPPGSPPERCTAYACWVVDYLWNAMPHFLRCLPRFLE